MWVARPGEGETVVAVARVLESDAADGEADATEGGADTGSGSDGESAS